MQNTFIPDAIDIVSRAITADNDGDYDKALSLYRDALSRFTIGLKYEKNESKKRLIIERVEGYMKRAEELRDYLNKQSEVDRNGGGPGGGAGGAGTKPKGAGEDDADAEKAKLRGALSGAIVTEKPNVKWDDVAGLEKAKESLKETVIMPTRFPQLFTGKRRPFKGILLYGPPGTGELSTILVMCNFLSFLFLTRSVTLDCECLMPMISSTHIFRQTRQILPGQSCRHRGGLYILFGILRRSHIQMARRVRTPSSKPLRDGKGIPRSQGNHLYRRS